MTWRKPNSIRSIDWATYHSLPGFITVRETRVYIEHPGFRTKVLIVVTTLLDPIQYPKEDLANLYRARWNNELDLRPIKSVMQLECKHMLKPRSFSFKGTLQTLEAFQPLIAMQGNQSSASRQYFWILGRICGRIR